MIELTFEQFHEKQYQEEGFRLYVVKNRHNDVLYIGISTTNIWERWFSWGGHIVWDGKVIYGESPIGTKIEDHLPDSLRWKIQLWTLDDCIQFCRAELPKDISALTIHQIEPIMIQKLSPAFNVTHNLQPGKDTSPKSKKEMDREQYLDEMYKKIFDKKP